MSGESSQPIEQWPTREDGPIEIWGLFVDGLRERDAVKIIAGMLIGGVGTSYYIKRGFQVIAPIIIGAAFLGLLVYGGYQILLLLWETIQSPPTVPPEATLMGAGIMVGTLLLVVVGYYAEKNGWMEGENNDPF